MSAENIGSSFDDFLKEEGIYEETREIALKRVVAWQTDEAMHEQDAKDVGTAERLKRR